MIQHPDRDNPRLRKIQVSKGVHSLTSIKHVYIHEKSRIVIRGGKEGNTPPNHDRNRAQ